MKKSFLILTWVFLALLFLMVIVPMAWGADSNTVSSTVVTNSTPPSANSPAVNINSSDVCRHAYSGAVSSVRVGISSGQTAVDANCELMRLSKLLFAFSMKVASVSLLSQDPRVFDALWMSATYPPLFGTIGLDAREEWKKNIHLIPKGSVVINILKKEIKEEERIAKAELKRKEDLRIKALQAENRKKSKEFFKNLFKPKPKQ